VTFWFLSDAREMPHYKLIYFPVRGRGEHIKYILAQAAVPHESVVMAFADWAKFKPTTPMGGLPILEIDGKPLAQACSISRYLAEQYGLTGKNAVEKAYADMLCEGVADLWKSQGAIIDAVLSNDMAKKEVAYKKFRTDALIPFLTMYSKFLKNNGTGFFVGNALTHADLMVAEFVDRVETSFGDDIVKKRLQRT